MKRPDQPGPLGRIRRLCARSLLPGGLRRDVDDELAFHLRRAEEALRAAGMDARSARAEARRRFGDVDAYRRELEAIDRSREVRLRWAERAGVLREQVAYALRGMRRTPLFTGGVVLTLGLGIGANATIFGVVDRLLLRPPPGVDQPDQVRRLYVSRADGRTGLTYTGSTITYPDYRDFQRAESFSQVGAYQPPTAMTVGEGAAAERASVVWATASFLDLLGTRPALGRFFGADEDRVGAPGTAVLGHAYWKARYGADPTVLGRTIRVRGDDYAIVGVAPEGFHGIDLEPVDLWLPLHVAAHALYSRGEDPTLGAVGGGWEDNRSWYWLKVVARARRDVPPEAAAAEATALHRAGRRERIDAGRYDPDATVLPAHVLAARGPNAPGEAVVSSLLAGVALMVLLIACANVANLMLARSIARRREIAVRLSLGVSRRRLVCQLLVESLAVALLGGLAALAIAFWGSLLVRSVLLPDVAWTGSPVDGRVAAFTAAVAFLTGIGTGLLPALQSSRPDLVSWLRTDGGGGSGRTSRTRVALLVTQAALSAVLLVGAGLFVKSLLAVQDVDTGLRTEGLLLARLELTPGEWALEDRVRAFDDAAARMRRLPGVVSVAVTTTIPFRNSWGVPFGVPGRDSIPRPRSGGPYGHAVSAGYFETVGVRVLRGRGISAEDRPGSPQVIVVNESLAAGLWPGLDPLGRCVEIGDGAEPACTTVVGVAADVRRQELIEDEQWLYYIPLAQRIVDEPPEGIFVRTESDRAGLALELRGAALAVDQVSFATVHASEDLIAPQLRPWTLAATTFVAFGLLALSVAGVGLYSVLAFNVAQRTREMGIRAALGATRGRIHGLVFREALGLAGMGLALGIALSLPLAGAVRDRLYEVAPSDPAVLCGAVLTVLGVAAVAGLVPARKAAAVPPSIALRAE